MIQQVSNGIIEILNTQIYSGYATNLLQYMFNIYTIFLLKEHSLNYMVRFLNFFKWLFKKNYLKQLFLKHSAICGK